MQHRLNRLMFTFYYRYTRLLNQLLPSITLGGQKLRVLPTIYKPLDDEHRLAECIEAGKTVLDVGCGSGVLTVFVAPKSKHVTAVDINPEAVENTRQNCEAQGLTNTTVQVSDMFSTVEDTYDIILSYPPLFRIPFKGSHQQWGTSTYFLDVLFQDARKYLRPDGRLVVMLPKAYQPTPESLGEKNGYFLQSIQPHPARSFATRLHGLIYLHRCFKPQVYTFGVKDSPIYKP